MKKILLLATAIVFLNYAHENYYKIYEDCPAYDGFGYNNCDINTNGEQLVIKNFINEGIVFDVGAAVGDWSLLALSQSQSIILYAFEPIPETFNHLKYNLKNYNVSPFNLAFSHFKGQRNIAWYNQTLGWAELSSFYQRKEVERSCNLSPVFLTVNTYDLDSFCEEQAIHYIDFLKIDTEGSELDIFKGSKRMLSNKKIKCIQFEYGGTYLDANITLREVFEMLTKYGYALFRIIPSGLIKIDKWRDALENYNYSNYLAISDIR